VAGEPIRVYLADDHPMFLAGVAGAVGERAELDLVGQAINGTEALADLRQLRPAVAVLDVRMCGLSGMDLLAAVTRERLPVRVVLLSAYLDSGLIYEALAAGAAGYLSKDADRDTVIDAVVSAARGDIVVGAEAQTGLVEEIRQRERLGRPLLSPREREVLGLAADGRSTAEIASLLHLGTTTVKSHLQNVFEKLGVSDRTAAVAVALRKRLLD